MGPCGVGKTTIVERRLGLYQPQAGRIMVGGVPRSGDGGRATTDRPARVVADRVYEVDPSQIRLRTGDLQRLGAATP